MFNKSTFFPLIGARVLILGTLVLGGTLLRGDYVGYAINGTAIGVFGGVDVTGSYSADLSQSSITVYGAPGSVYTYSYTFTGPVNGKGYSQTSQIPPLPCIIAGCIMTAPGQASLSVFPVTSVLADIGFEDTGELFTGTGTLVGGSILTNLQGGPSSSAPVSLPGPGPVAEITGSLTQETLEDWYKFEWGSGAFSVTASVPDAPSDASYSFSVGVAGTCSSDGSTTLNSANGFTSTIAIANLAAGQYCIGISTNSLNDPAFGLTFNTPVTGIPAASGVPEPSGLVLPSIGFMMTVGWRLLARPSRRQRTEAQTPVE